MSESMGVTLGHPLLAKDISRLANWSEWKEKWEQAKTAEECAGLLHFGLYVPMGSGETWVERICFYLEVADGHGCCAALQGPRDGSDSLARVRQMVAEKAFAALCAHVFKRGLIDRHDYNPWGAGISGLSVFLDKVLWFFRLRDSGAGFVNVGREEEKDNHTQIARAFLLNMCRFAWGFGRERKELSSRLPQLVEALCGLGKLDLLLNKDWVVDERCEEKLEQLALRWELWLPQASGQNSLRRPRTVGEAVYGGSRAAEVLFLLRMRRDERRRWEKVREAEEQCREAERRVNQAVALATATGFNR